MVKRYTPQAGDLVWLEFDPQSGHEQSGHRPALVVSESAYNGKTGLAVFCPVTSKEKGYPFEVRLASVEVEGVVLADQVKSLDWRARRARYIATVPDRVLKETISKLSALFPK